MGDDELTALSAALGSASAAARSAALERLAELKPSQAPELVVPLLHDPDPEVRSDAVFCLGELAVESTLPHLLEAAIDQDGKVRGEAFAALARFRAPEIVRLLAAEVESPWQTRRTRREAALQLRYYDSPLAVEALAKLLVDEGAAHVDGMTAAAREIAAESLLVLNREELRPLWTEALQDPIVAIRGVAGRALAALKDG